MGPLPRSFHAMAFDSFRNRSILFGGGGSSGLFGDTWDWDGAQWTQHLAPGPTPRNSHVIAYDSARDRIVIFGGHNGSAYLNETWEWDGASWTQMVISGSVPGPRVAAAMAYDSFRGSVILFGGAYADTSLHYRGDTWAWDGSSWTQLAMSGPSPTPRYAHRMTFDSGLSRVVLFGGYDGAIRGDTWEWDGSTWVKRTVTGPTARASHAMAYDAAGTRVVLYGGDTAIGTFSNDTWEYHGVRLGDLNDDGDVNGLDIAPLVIAMLSNSTDPVDLYLADFNGDAILDEGDLSEFVSTLLADPS